MLSNPRPDKNHVILRIGCIGSHVPTSSSDFGFYSRLRQTNDVSLCKLDVNVKSRSPVAGSVGLFKLETLQRKSRYFIASFTLKIKSGKSKGMQEKSVYHGCMV